MIALDTDVLSDVLAGKPAVTQRLAGIDPAEWCVAVVAAAEVLRGWLGAIRQAEAGKGRVSLERGYQQFERSVVGLVPFKLLSYTATADALFRQWKAARIRIGTNDLRIAAICQDHGAKLVTRNARDYAQVPGLNFDVWN